MSSEARIVALFAAREIGYTLRSETSRPTGAEGSSGPEAAQVTVAFRKGRPVMLVSPAGRPIDPSRAARVLGQENIRWAEPAELEVLFPGCESGAIPALGPLYGIPMVIDTDLARDPDITFSTGTRGQTVTLTMRAYEHLTWPIHATLTKQERAAA